MPGLKTEELRRNGSFEAGVLGFVDNAHPPAAKVFEDLVVGNRLADHVHGSLELFNQPPEIRVLPVSFEIWILLDPVAENCSTLKSDFQAFEHLFFFAQ